MVVGCGPELIEPFLGLFNGGGMVLQVEGADRLFGNVAETFEGGDPQAVHLAKVKEHFTEVQR